MIPPTCSVNCR